jgi:hypothetical protein
MIKCDNAKCFWNNLSVKANAGQTPVCLKQYPELTISEFTPGRHLTCLSFQDLYEEKVKVIDLDKSPEQFFHEDDLPECGEYNDCSECEELVCPVMQKSLSYSHDFEDEKRRAEGE